MGYRSTITGQDYPIKWPDWFKDKYQGRFLLMDSTCINNKYETKFYDNDVFEDIQKAIDWEEFRIGRTDKYLNVVYAILHEDGAISKVVIFMDKIEYTWMEEGHEADAVWMQT